MSFHLYCAVVWALGLPATLFLPSTRSHSRQESNKNKQTKGLPRERDSRFQSIPSYIFIMFSLFILFLISSNLLVQSLPVVDKGVFVITGVKTCGLGSGYCVLGGDCSVDKEFSPDLNGHCDGLRKAFTPRAYFVCCEYIDESTTTTSTTSTTSTTPASTPDAQSDEVSVENDSSPESKESSSVESGEDKKPTNNNNTATVDLASLSIQQAAPISTVAITTEAAKSGKPEIQVSTTTPAAIFNSDSEVNDNMIVLDMTEKTVESNTLSSISNNTNENLMGTDIIVPAVTGVSTVASEKTPAHDIYESDPNNSVNLHDEAVTVMDEKKTESVAVNSSFSNTNLPPKSSSVLLFNETTPLESVSSTSSSLGLETTTPGEKDHPTTVISYSEKTEISVEESVSLHVKQCGMKIAAASARIDSPRFASQSLNGATSSCWTGAIVRSPSTMNSMNADPGSFLCSGALIYPSVLLTTATCASRLFSQDLSLFKVALGSDHLVHPMNGPTPDADYRDIKELIIHESYVVDGHLRINDIALVILKEAADLTKTKTCTLCLPQGKHDFQGRDCIVTGYSHPSSDNSAMESDGILHEAHQHVLYHSNCETVLANFTQHSFRTGGEMDGLLCASGKYSAEACFSPRDAGSPLACEQNGVYVLAGSFSSGFHCGTQEMPVAYTNIANYADTWIYPTILRRLSYPETSHFGIA